MLLEVRAVMRLVVFALVAAGCYPPGYDKPRPDAPVDATPVTADAAVDSTAPLVCDHAFRLTGYATAASVWLTGSFVSWAANTGAGAVAFTLGNDGAWAGSHDFEAGTHQYKFIVDGSTWILDPANPNTAGDGMGNTNSVYTCVP